MVVLEAKLGLSSGDCHDPVKKVSQVSYKLYIFAQMLAARFPDPNLAAWHTRGLEAFARCIAAFPNLMPVILQKVHP